MDSKPKTWKLILVGICAGVLLTGTLAVASPAVASAPVKIGKIWKAIKKKADKRYYTKAASDAKYMAKPKVIRGNFAHTIPADSAGDFVASSIGFGVTLPGAPISHYIKSGAAVPVGCSGDATSPSAAPGHLCVFEGQVLNLGSQSITGAIGSGPANRSGALVYGYAVAAGQSLAYGSWAVGTGPSAVWAKSSTTVQDGVPAGKD